MFTTVLCGAALCAAPALANPTGGVVSAGQANITQSGNTLDVTETSNKAVINWTGFNISPNETTQFFQPSSSAIVLNRVNSNSASLIQGTLTANGNIIIINQNGVLFGAGSTVDVNGLVATTANISDNAFMNNATGMFTFDQPGNPNASIINNGTITAAQAGLVGLVAPNVINNGTIMAKLGRVQLGSGDTATVDMYGDGLMQVAVSPQVTSQLVANNGLIQAPGGKVQLTAAAGENIINSLITVPGEIEAPAVAEQNGEILIYAQGSNAVPDNVAANKGQASGNSEVLISGTLDASGKGAGQTGGTITVTGDHVAVLSGANIDASGDAGGGVIQVGGDFHGQGTTPTAEATVVQQGSTINANAITTGNGGNVTVWADDYTDFEGFIQARGGAQSGNGGYVETSGKQSLIVAGNVDAGAPNGTGGIWLLDPSDLTITGNATSGTTTSSGSNPITWQTTSGSDEDQMNAATIDSELNAGTSVIIQTSNTGSGGAGNITVASAISATTGAGNVTGNLTLSAYQDINVNAGITLGGTGVTGGALTLDSANSGNNIGGISINANIATNGGNITMGGGSSGITAGMLNADGTLNTAASGFAVGDANSQWGGVAIGNYTINACSNGTCTGSSGGSIIINGRGSNSSTFANYGVFIDESTIETDGSGTINISGIGGGGSSAGEGYGVALFTSGAIYTVNGNLTIIGTGGNSAGQNFGIYNNNWISILGSGNALINGTGGSVGTGNIGVYNNDEIRSNGNVTALGTAGVGSGSDGIENKGVIGVFATTGGTLTVTGNTTATGSTSYGVYNYYGQISSACTSGCGAMNITGTSTQGAYGLYILDNSGIYSNAASITLTGTAPSGTGIYDSGSHPIGGAGENGNITFIADTLAFASSNSIQTTGNVLIKPYTSGTAVNVGSQAGGLQITDTDLGDITAGSLTIGDSTNTGAMDINTAHTFAMPVTFMTGSGNNITLDGQLTSSASGDAVVLASGNNFINNYGLGAISLIGSGRFIGYSYKESDDTNPLSVPQTIIGYTYSTLPPAEIISPTYSGTDNTWVYAVASPAPAPSRLPPAARQQSVCTDGSDAGTSPRTSAFACTSTRASPVAILRHDIDAAWHYR